jgi:hypothetical protein
MDLETGSVDINLLDTRNALVLAFLPRSMRPTTLREPAPRTPPLGPTRPSIDGHTVARGSNRRDAVRIRSADGVAT